eukprot:INCI5875.5.p1 GENE.INCI5875.5~~INCI5875.5.p1  ORF type:complete len:333 (+),score=35.47 INCI5875.5:123-1001(+)
MPGVLATAACCWFAVLLHTTGVMMHTVSAGGGMPDQQQDAARSHFFASENDATSRQVLVRDRLFSMLEMRRIHEAVRRLPYMFGETDFEGASPAGAVRDLDVSHLVGPGGAGGRSQPHQDVLEQQIVSHLLDRLRPVANELLANKSLSLLLESGVEAMDRAVTPHAPYRAYVNQFRRGDHPTPHRDAALGSPHLTVLMYANSNWKRDWGSETLFYTEGSHEISKAVRPRPGRVVFFTGGVLHSARPPLPDVVEPRYSIALKFWLRPLEMQEAGASAAFGEKRRQASTDRDDL